MAGDSVAEAAEPIVVVLTAGSVEDVFCSPSSVKVSPSVVIVVKPVGNRMVASLSTMPDGPMMIVDPSDSVIVSRVDGTVIVEPSMMNSEVGPLLDMAVDGAGPSVKVLLPNVMIVNSVIDEPRERVKMVVSPLGSVKVSTTEPEDSVAAVGAGPSVSVDPSVMTVVRAVEDEPGPNVRMVVGPPGSVKVSTTEEEAPFVVTGAGPTVSVDSPTINVVSPVMEEAEARVNVIDEPSASVKVSTIDLSVEVCGEVGARAELELVLCLAEVLPTEEEGPVFDVDGCEELGTEAEPELVPFPAEVLPTVEEGSVFDADGCEELVTEAELELAACPTEVSLTEDEGSVLEAGDCGEVNSEVVTVDVREDGSAPDEIEILEEPSD